MLGVRQLLTTAVALLTAVNRCGRKGSHDCRVRCCGKHFWENPPLLIIYNAAAVKLSRRSRNQQHAAISAQFTPKLDEISNFDKPGIFTIPAFQSRFKVYSMSMFPTTQRSLQNSVRVARITSVFLVVPMVAK